MTLQSLFKSPLRIGSLLLCQISHQDCGQGGCVMSFMGGCTELLAREHAQREGEESEQRHLSLPDAQMPRC